MLVMILLWVCSAGNFTLVHQSMLWLYFSLNCAGPYIGWIYLAHGTMHRTSDALIRYHRSFQSGNINKVYSYKWNPTPIPATHERIHHAILLHYFFSRSSPEMNVNNWFDVGRYNFLPHTPHIILRACCLVLGSCRTCLPRSTWRQVLWYTFTCNGITHFLSQNTNINNTSFTFRL